MDQQTELALLKQEVRALAAIVEKQGETLRDLNLSIARFKGMAGMALMLGALLMAAAKMALGFIKR